MKENIIFLENLFLAHFKILDDLVEYSEFVEYLLKFFLIF